MRWLLDSWEWVFFSSNNKNLDLNSTLWKNSNIKFYVKKCSNKPKYTKFALVRDEHFDMLLEVYLDIKQIYLTANNNNKAVILSTYVNTYHAARTESLHHCTCLIDNTKEGICSRDDRHLQNVFNAVTFDITFCCLLFLLDLPSSKWTEMDRTTDKNNMESRKQEEGE